MSERTGVTPNDDGSYDENPGWAEECMDCGALTFWNEDGFGSDICVECGGDTVEVPA